MAIKDDEVSSADTDRSAQDSLRRRRVQAVECHAENEKKLKKKEKKEKKDTIKRYMMRILAPALVNA
jgi:type II secretory pathway component PulF